MKKVIVMFMLVFAFSTALTSCRDTNKEKGDIEETADDMGDAIEDAADDIGDAVEEGVDEVKENTGTGGTDDN
ncbi:hypothetical protein ACE939_10710 [Aquimarina sp. W85]|uniref:hypothetical protein n=1 Tax=Aquimarina rhodophyticola TaxID=3342246 RepID=UPI00366D8158